MRNANVRGMAGSRKQALLLTRCAKKELYCKLVVVHVLLFPESATAIEAGSLSATRAEMTIAPVNLRSSRALVSRRADSLSAPLVNTLF